MTVRPGDFVEGSVAFLVMSTWQRLVVHLWLNEGQLRLHSFLHELPGDFAAPRLWH